MRKQLFGFAAAGLIAVIAAVGWSSASPGPRPFAVDLPGQRSPGAIPVDVELVLAVDISYSMDPDELALQREGYQQALTSPEFLNALKGGMHGRIAVTYFEWAGSSEQRVVMPWRLLDSEASPAPSLKKSVRRRCAVLSAPPSPVLCALLRRCSRTMALRDCAA